MTKVVWMKGKLGFLTPRQIKVLKYRLQGYSTREIAELIGVSHQDVAVSIKRALKNIEKARHTLLVYALLYSPVKIVVKEGTRLVDIPGIVLGEADKAGIRVRADFTIIFKLLRFKASDCIAGKVVKKPVLILLNPRGEVEVVPFSEVAGIIQAVESIG